MDENAYASLVQSTKQFALLAETLQRNASATIEQQKQSALELQNAADRANSQMQATINAVGEQLGQMLRQSVDRALAPGTDRFENIARTTTSHMQQASDAMQKGQATAAFNMKRLTWKLHAIAIASTLILVAGGSILIYHQAQAYKDAHERARIANIEANIAEALMDADITSCGGKPCVKLDLKARRWGRDGEYVLLDGIPAPKDGK